MFGKFIIIAAVALLFSCNSKPPYKHKEMVEVLSDVMLLEGGNQVQYNFGNIPDWVWERDYVFVCKKHNMDTTAFRTNMNFLETHPDEFSAILEEVITKLQKAELNKNAPQP